MRENCPVCAPVRQPGGSWQAWARCAGGSCAYMGWRNISVARPRTQTPVGWKALACYGASALARCHAGKRLLAALMHGEV
eukprot:365530-Chlamydomonas_euryale.AAC.17